MKLSEFVFFRLRFATSRNDSAGVHDHLVRNQLFHYIQRAPCVTQLWRPYLDSGSGLCGTRAGIFP